MKSWSFMSAVLAFVLLSAQANAVGIAPSTMPINFEPNLDINSSVQVRNSANSSVDFGLYASGDLARYITFEKSTVTFGPGEIRALKFNIKLPATLEPGKHKNAIGVLEVLPAGGGVAAQIGVEMLLWVYVPYPDNYIAVDIANSGPALNQRTEFTVTLSNPARNDLTTTADLEIRDASDMMMDRFELGSGYIKVGESRTFQAGWTPRKAGDYKAVARASYVGNTTVKEKKFTVKVPATAPIPGFAGVEEVPPNLIPYFALIIVLVIAIIMVLVWPKGVKKNG